MIIVATLLWDANQHSFDFSKMYDESWVEKLYRGIMKHTTRRDIKFICYVDHIRDFKEDINQVLIRKSPPSYSACIEPFILGYPTMLMGLDTIITGNIDHLLEYCLSGKKFAVPRDPFEPKQVCNGVCLIPAGNSHVAIDHADQNDMEWIRGFDPAVIDDIFPGQVVSYKGHVKPRGGLGDERIVYFHGEEKPHQLAHLSWVTENWR